VIAHRRRDPERARDGAAESRLARNLVGQHSRLVYRSGNLKIGTRVPIELKQGEIEYFDLGTRISARIQNYQGPGPAVLSVSAEISSLAAPDQSPARDVKPILRQFTINGSTTWDMAVLGKPMVIGSVDDPDSKRTFQLEVTVTKLR
jgi:hypothetical protein